MICVPLISASPSFAESSTGARPTRASARFDGIALPSKNTSPSPISGSAMWASGARSPDAPTEPCDGIHGTMPALNIAIIASTSPVRTPEHPRAIAWIRSANARRLTSTGSGSPTPVACESRRLRCNVPSFASGTFTLASLPKPVLTP